MCTNHEAQKFLPKTQFVDPEKNKNQKGNRPIVVGTMGDCIRHKLGGCTFLLPSMLLEIVLFL